MHNYPALIETARQRDETTLMLLPRDCQPDLRRAAANQCACAADVDDAVQESLWLVYRRIRGLRSVGAYAAWRLSILRYECRRLNSRCWQ